MDRDLIEAKIESLRHCIERIASKMPCVRRSTGRRSRLAGHHRIEPPASRPTLCRPGRPCHRRHQRSAPIHNGGKFRHPERTLGDSSGIGRRNDEGRGVSKHCRSQLSSDRLENRLSDLQQPSRRLQTICSVNHSPAAIFLTLLQSRFLCPPRMEEMPNIHDQSCLIAHGKAGAARSSSAEATSGSRLDSVK